MDHTTVQRYCAAYDTLVLTHSYKQCTKFSWYGPTRHALII